MSTTIQVTPAAKAKLLAALRGARPESDPVQIAPGVQMTLRLVPVHAKATLRDEALAEAMAAATPGAGDDDFEDRVYGILCLRILAAALAHHGITLEDVRQELTTPVLRTLWSEYERLEALVDPVKDTDLDKLHDTIQALVQDSRSAAAIHLSTLGYTTLLRYAISTVGRPSS